MEALITMLVVLLVFSLLTITVLAVLLVNSKNENKRLKGQNRRLALQAKMATHKRNIIDEVNRRKEKSIRLLEKKLDKAEDRIYELKHIELYTYTFIREREEEIEKLKEKLNRQEVELNQKAYDKKLSYMAAKRSYF